MSIDVNEEDLSIFKQPLSTPQDLPEHLSFMPVDGNRKTEVNIRDLNPEERQLMGAAKDK